MDRAKALFVWHGIKKVFMVYNGFGVFRLNVALELAPTLN